MCWWWVRWWRHDSGADGRDHGADAMVIEKSGLYGGSTAMSGGSVWIPDNHLRRKRVDGLTEEALTYLKAVTAGKVSDGLTLRVYQGCPEMSNIWKREPRSVPDCAGLF